MYWVPRRTPRWQVPNKKLSVKANTATSPPHSACASSESPSLDRSVVPLYLILIVGTSRMLATGFSFPPSIISQALRVVTQGGKFNWDYYRFQINCSKQVFVFICFGICGMKIRIIAKSHNEVVNRASKITLDTAFAPIVGRYSRSSVTLSPTSD